ncbi:MAG: AMP-binding protein [Dehalococcoidia bacterium]
MEEFVRLGYWGKPSISELWDENALRHPHREALADSTNRYTWAQARQWYDRVALGFLELGLKKDDVVVTQLPNICETMLVYHALEKAGLLGLPTMMTMRHREMEYILTQTEAVGVIIVPLFHDFDYSHMVREIRQGLPQLKYVFSVGDDAPEGTISLKELAESPPERGHRPDRLEETRPGPFDLASLMMTSGTTGFPKFAERPNNFWVTGNTDVARWKMTADDVCAALAPVIGGPGGVVNRYTAHHVGARVVLLERFEAGEALKLIERERVTIASAVPAQMAMMVKHPDFDKYDYSSLRAFFYAGAVCPYNLAREVEERMGCRVITDMGAIDCGTITSTSIDDPPEVRRASVGKPYPGNAVRLLTEDGGEVSVGEVGEIVVKGALFSSGYYRDPDTTGRVWGRKGWEGWYRMGDLGRLDESGNLYVVGRATDMIIRGGQNIYPVEVENMLITHPGVLQVAIVPMPDPVMGEKACAFVIPQPGKSLTFDEMVDFLLEKRMAKFKIPERLEIVDSFPMSGDGQKVIKKSLADDVAGKLKEEGIA